MTTHEYDVVEQYRDLGGNLIFLYANNFFWQTVKRGKVLERTKLWRDLGRPEAALIGVQYRGSDGGHHKAPWIIRKAPAGRWLFAGTGLHQGSNLGEGSVEIDRTFPASPKNVQILAEIPNLFGPGFTAQMTYYDTPDGARVFAAGAFRLLQEPLSPRSAASSTTSGSTSRATVHQRSSPRRAASGRSTPAKPARPPAMTGRAAIKMAGSRPTSDLCSTPCQVEKTPLQAHG